MKTIPSLPGYKADVHGNIYSIKICGLLKLSQQETNRGYMSVRVRQNGKSVSKLVHRLVAETFIEKEGSNLNVVNHKDCNQKNNYYKNLEWCTQKQNLHHAKQNGKIEGGESLPQSKLKYSDCLDIEEMHKSGTSFRSISEIYNVSERTIRRVVKKETYKNRGK